MNNQKEDLENTDFVAQDQKSKQLDDYREMRRRKFEEERMARGESCVSEDMKVPLLGPP